MVNKMYKKSDKVNKRLSKDLEKKYGRKDYPTDRYWLIDDLVTSFDRFKRDVLDVYFRKRLQCSKCGSIGNFWVVDGGYTYDNAKEERLVKLECMKCGFTFRTSWNSLEQTKLFRGNPPLHDEVSMLKFRQFEDLLNLCLEGGNIIALELGSNCQFLPNLLQIIEDHIKYYKMEVKESILADLDTPDKYLTHDGITQEHIYLKPNCFPQYDYGIYSPYFFVFDPPRPKHGVAPPLPSPRESHFITIFNGLFVKHPMFIPEPTVKTLLHFETLKQYFDIVFTFQIKNNHMGYSKVLGKNNWSIDLDFTKKSIIVTKNDSIEITLPFDSHFNGLQFDFGQKKYHDYDFQKTSPRNSRQTYDPKDLDSICHMWIEDVMKTITTSQTGSSDTTRHLDGHWLGFYNDDIIKDFISDLFNLYITEKGERHLNFIENCLKETSELNNSYLCELPKYRHLLASHLLGKEITIFPEDLDYNDSNHVNQLIWLFTKNILGKAINQYPDIKTQFYNSFFYDYELFITIDLLDFILSFLQYSAPPDFPVTKCLNDLTQEITSITRIMFKSLSLDDIKFVFQVHKSCRRANTLGKVKPIMDLYRVKLSNFLLEDKLKEHPKEFIFPAPGYRPGILEIKAGIRKPTTKLPSVDIVVDELLWYFINNRLIPNDKAGVRLGTANKKPFISYHVGYDILQVILSVLSNINTIDTNILNTLKDLDNYLRTKIKKIHFSPTINHTSELLFFDKFPTALPLLRDYLNNLQKSSV